MILKEIEAFHYLLDIDGYRIREITLEEVQQRRGMHCECIAGYELEGNFTKCTDTDNYPLTVFRAEQIHVIPDFETKEDLKKALAARETVEIHSPGGFIKEGRQVTLEGPYGPILRKWYVDAHIVDNKIVKITRGFDEGPWRSEEAT